MERLKTVARNGVASNLLDQKKFTHDSLIELGFDFMGFCWGWKNKPYHQIDTQIGELCIVDYNEVYLVRKREELLARIDTLEKLKQFVLLTTDLGLTTNLEG